MIIDSTENNWRLGELACLKWNDEQIKKAGQKSYAYCAVSRYICVREATEGQCGILVKVVGKISKEHIMFVNGEPFCKDEREDLFKGKCYYSFPFPTLNALKEVLAIVRDDPSLMQRFEEESMHFNPSSTFWVRSIARRMLGARKLQFFDADTGQLSKAIDDTPHYRLTIAYFDKDELNW